jgi:hypothetical protein
LPVPAARHVTEGAVVISDNPPFGLSVRIWQILPAWEPGPPAAQGWRYTVQPVRVFHAAVGKRMHIGRPRVRELVGRKARMVIGRPRDREGER